jgi:chromate reductase
MRVLGISGSLRQASHNTALLRAASEYLPEDAQLVVYDQLREIPAYDEDLEAAGPAPASVVAFRDAIAAADAVLFATPEYNGSVPGALKNALDWASRPAGKSVLQRKPVAVVGASTGLFGAVWAQAELRKILSTIGATVIGENELPLGQAHEAFHPDGALIDEDHREGLAGLVAELTGAIEDRELERIAA